MNSLPTGRRHQDNRINITGLEAYNKEIKMMKIEVKREVGKNVIVLTDEANGKEEAIEKIKELEDIIESSKKSKKEKGAASKKPEKEKIVTVGDQAKVLKKK
jgi:hypothetical protein